MYANRNELKKELTNTPEKFTKDFHKMVEYYWDRLVPIEQACNQ